MGLTGSKDSEDEMSTPPKIGTHKRILEFDPRSPSVEISRTPIMVEKTPEGVLDPRSPTVGIIRTPITTLGGHTQSDLAPLMSEIEVDEENNADEDDVTDTDKLLQEMRDMPEIEALSIADTKSTMNESTKKNKKRAVKVPQPKQLFPSHIKDGVTRSPLATRTIDMNSPRVIVQRKQTKKIENSKSCALEHVSSRVGAHDKENIHQN